MLDDDARVQVLWLSVSTSIQHCANVHPQERVCVYNYNTTLYQREDIQGQSVTTYATVEIACDSSEYMREARAHNEPHPLFALAYSTTAGKFAYDNATKYCMVVTEAYIEHAGLNG